MRADLAQFFNINIDDVWAGTVPAHHVNALIAHLMLIPHSRVYAIENGDLAHMGWDIAASIAASTHNLIAMVAAGLSKDVDLEQLLIHAPGDDEPPAPKYPTIAEFSEAGFTKFMYGEE